MRRACSTGLLLALSACAAQPEVTQCPEVRPQVCTMEYAPACGVLRAGARREHASPCNACADDEVQGYEMGPCPT